MPRPLEAHNPSHAIPFSSVCGPTGAAAAPGQQLQVLEGPGRHEAAEPAATRRPGVVSPWPVSNLPSVNSSPPKVTFTPPGLHALPSKCSL